MRYFVAPEGWLDESGQMKALFTSPVGVTILRLRQAHATVHAVYKPGVRPILDTC